MSPVSVKERWDEGCRILISRLSPFLKEISAAAHLPVTGECGLLGSSKSRNTSLPAAHGGRLTLSALLFLLCLMEWNVNY